MFPFFSNQLKLLIFFPAAFSDGTHYFYHSLLQKYFFLKNINMYIILM